MVKLNPSHEHIDKHPEREGQTENDIYYFNYICSKSNHNDCVLFQQQKMSKQLGLSCFFKQAPASQKRDNNGKLICSYCLKSFSPQGFPIHVLYHKSHGDRKRLAPPKYGRVKIRNTSANASIEEVLAIDVEEVQQDIDVAFRRLMITVKEKLS